MNTLKITTDILPDIFENVIDACKSNETVTVIRSNLKKFEDIDKWVRMFGHNTRTHWNVRDSVPDGVQMLCSKKFVCHHSRFMKVRYENNKNGVSKNANCLSQIVVKIKLNTRNTRAKDNFVKKGLCGMVTIKNIHSHAISSAQSLRFLPADLMVKYKFWDYFDDGMGISESKKHHQRIIQLMGGSGDDLASGRCNPTYRTVRHWYDQWRLEHLGPRTGDGVIETLKEEETPALDSADSIVNFDVKLEAQGDSWYEEITVENPKIMYTNALSAEDVTPVSDLL